MKAEWTSWNGMNPLNDERKRTVIIYSWNQFTRNSFELKQMKAWMIEWRAGCFNRSLLAFVLFSFTHCSTRSIKHTPRNPFTQSIISSSMFILGIAIIECKGLQWKYCSTNCYNINQLYSVAAYFYSND